jgi:exopolyphosphatase / guanosine-5'-triphosphate,3'-diphosphate pyrophosphatase
MAKAATIGAVDAGTNAVRVVIARAESPGAYVRLHKERWPLRLGHQVYTRKRFGPRTLTQAVEAFAHFRDLFDRFEVDAYRAVATSATREAANRHTLLERIERAADIRLDVVSGEEEARFTRVAVQNALADTASPQVILDIGGGSLEIIRLASGEVIDSISFPIGTVRLMETFGITGRIEAADVRMLRRYVHTLLSDYYGDTELSADIAVGCGGNVEALAEIAGGSKRFGVPVLHFDRLADVSESILERDVHERMAAFSVRRDRAEVMGIAAVVLSTAAEFLGLGGLLAPDVGVREGVLLDLSHRSAGPDERGGDDHRRWALLDAAWSFAKRFQDDEVHAEYVRRLSASIFDQLREHHGLGQEYRLALELGAILHDIGNAVCRHKHHKHGEYIVEHAQIEGLDDRLHTIVTALVRHHDKSFPAKRHSTFSSLDDDDQRAVEKLAGMLRIADGLDAHYGQSVEAVDVEVDGAEATFRLTQSEPSELPLLGARQKGHLFEVAFDLKPVFVG